MGVAGPDGEGVELAVGQVVELDVSATFADGPLVGTIRWVGDETFCLCGVDGHYTEILVNRVIAHQREESHDDGTTTRVQVVRVRMSDDTRVTHRLSNVTVDEEYGISGEMVPLAPPIDPNVMALVKAIEAGECDIDKCSRAVAIERLHIDQKLRVVTRRRKNGIEDFDWWVESYLGDEPMPSEWSGRIDLTEVRRLLEERAAE